MKYEGSPKHKSGGSGSICPPTINQGLAQRLLEGGIKHSKSGKRVVYNIHEGQAYAAREHRRGFYHGYPIKGIELPAKVLRKLKKRRKITTAEYNKLRKES